MISGLDATGSVTYPLQAGGFDISYALGGPDIGKLLPLRGAWSLAGHYVDSADRHVFDGLKARVAGAISAVAIVTSAPGRARTGGETRFRRAAC